MYLQAIPIKGQKYKVYMDETDHYTLGYCDKNDKKIVISNKCPKDKFIATLAHEISHAFIHECFLDQTLEPTQEEIFCEIVSCIIEQFGDFFLDLKEIAFSLKAVQ